MSEAIGTSEKGPKTEIGFVVSNKGEKTAVIKITRLTRHRIYKKYIQRSKKYYAHDEKNECNIGDRVQIVETRPISKLKRWKISSILERAK